MDVVVFCGQWCCVVVCGWCVCFWGIYPSFGEFNLVGVGLMGCMSMCVLSVLLRTFCSSSGVCRFVVGCDWLCMQIIDVRVGSVYW